MHYELGIRCPELRGKDHFIAPSADIIGNVILENLSKRLVQCRHSS